MDADEVLISDVFRLSEAGSSSPLAVLGMLRWSWETWLPGGEGDGAVMAIILKRQSSGARTTTTGCC